MDNETVCKKCGASTFSGAPFCGKCGASIRDLPARKQRRLKKRHILGGFIIFILMAAVVIAVVAPNNTTNTTERTTIMPTATPSASVTNTPSAAPSSHDPLLDKFVAEYTKENKDKLYYKIRTNFSDTHVLSIRDRWGTGNGGHFQSVEIGHGGSVDKVTSKFNLLASNYLGKNIDPKFRTTWGLTAFTVAAGHAPTIVREINYQGIKGEHRAYIQYDDVLIDYTLD